MTWGTVCGIDPETGHHYDNTRRYVDAIDWLSETDKQRIFEGNARKVYPRLRRRLSWLVSVVPFFLVNNLLLPN
jgi:4-oxalmesaconate hydratase